MKSHRQMLSRLFLVLITVIIGLPTYAAAQQNPADDRVTVVLWVSLDGVRPDYLDRAKLPFLHRLMREGAFSKHLVPVFPSLTFPSHVSQATGVPVAQHGITANAFYDKKSRRILRYVNDSAMLRSTAIWNVASGQNRRTLVHDWPLSYAQSGDDRAAYFNDKYEDKLTDEQRCIRLLEAYHNDTDASPLQLLMLYLPQVDKDGHTYGPDSPEAIAAMEQTDALLGALFDGVVDKLNRTLGQRAQLIVLITTDHGMTNCHTMANLERLIGADNATDVTIVTSGNFAQVYLDKLPEAQRETRTQQILEALKAHPYARAYTPQTAPDRWRFFDPERSGDIVVILDTGYTFTGRRGVTTQPTAQTGPLGMHGCDVEDSKDMLGMMIAWRRHDAWGGIDLGEVHSLQLHPTVAKWLGVKPSVNAKASPIEPLTK
jgi:hypothetical protein